MYRRLEEDEEEDKKKEKKTSDDDENNDHKVGCSERPRIHDSGSSQEVLSVCEFRLPLLCQ